MLHPEQSFAELQVQNWGTFDVANYGDLLFPLILEAEIKKRIPDLELTLYSPHGGWFEPQPTRWVEPIHRLENRGFFPKLANCQGIILGGGDIIRFDDRAMASIYGITEEQAEQERSYRVFIEDLGQIAPWVPVVWNAVGVPFEFDEQQSLVLKKSLESVSYLSVRDEFSKKKLEDSGITREIHVVPDTGFLVARHYPKDTLASIKEVLVQTGQFPAQGEVLCFQISYGATHYLQDLIAALRKILEINSNLQLVFLSIGLCHSDLLILKNIQEQINNRIFLINETTEPKIIAAVIANSDYFAGSSLHGNITAYAYGIPHLFLDFFNLAKIRGIASMMSSEQRLITHVSMLMSALPQLIQQHKDWDRPLPNLIKQIDSHFDRCAEFLQKPRIQVLPVEKALNSLDRSNEALHFVLREGEAKLKKTYAEWEQFQIQLQQTQTQKEQFQIQLQQTRTELELTQSQLQQTQTQKEQFQIQLQQTQVELELTQSQLQQSQSQKEQFQAQLQQTQVELELTQSQLQQSQSQKEQFQAQLQQTRVKLERSQALISAMESSKFWKLRTGWFRLKQAIGLPDDSPRPDSATSFPQIIDSPATNSSSLKTIDLLASTAISGVNDIREIKFKATSKDSPNGFFDGINGASAPIIPARSIKAQKPTPLNATGWAILAKEGRPADRVIITCGKNNSLVAVATVNLERPDVVKALKNHAYKNCGWSIILNPSTLPPGKVVLKAWAYSAVRKEAIQLKSMNSNLQLSKIFPRLKYFYAILRVRGTRYAIGRLTNKVNEVIPVVSNNDDPYSRWLNKNFPREADLRKMAETVEIFGYKPVISVIMPVFNPPEYFLREAIESVLNQVYPYWELCIADDTSTKLYVKEVLKEYASKDPRIKVVFRNENGHISRASNSALEIATGEFIALLDHDDLLTADALYEIALLLNRHSDADMVYSDEDKIDQQNQVKSPFFKPDWCPDSLLSRMYTCHLGVYRRSLVTEIGGFRVGYEGSQDYDLVLRITEKTENIYHIPKILYHWRIHSDSTASNLSNKDYATDASEKAILDALSRRNEPGKVTTIAGGHHLVRYEIKDLKLVSIIIPTKNLGSVVDKCLASIFEKTKYPNYEVLLIDNGSTEAETRDVINKWKLKEPNKFRCEVLDIPFNFSRINNYAVEQAKGEYLLFLNNDTEVITPDWIEAMVEQAQRSHIGAVGALLLYPDNTIQHAGVMCVGGVAGHSHKHFPYNSPGYYYQIQTINNYSAVTAACLMCRREVFEAVGGFEEELTVAFNDVDLCFKMLEKGYRNIYLPHVVLYHYESKSRGYEDTPKKQARFVKEMEYMQTKWKKILEHDPCYSPNLTKKREDFSIGE